MKRTWVMVVGAVAIAAAAGGAVWARVRAARAARAGAHPRAIAVRIARAHREDVPVTVEGLGTVTPLYTATVKTLVDGQLDRVFFDEGQYVHKGDRLALVDPRPFEVQEQQAQAARAKDEANRHNAKVTLDRDTALFHEGLATPQQVDNDRASLEMAAASVKADDAQIRAAALNVAYAHIASPIDGVTGIRLVDPGNIVHPADPGGLVIVTQLDPISVIFTLPEDDLPRVVAAREHGAPRVTALSRDGQTELGTGELTVIDNQINVQTATLRLRAQMANPEKLLWPNEFVKARLLLETKKNVLVVPAMAVQQGPSGTFVYVVDAHDVAATRPVAADEIEGDRAIVTRGLTEGERVVVEGQAQLKPGAKVAIRAGSKP